MDNPAAMLPSLDVIISALLVIYGASLVWVIKRVLALEKEVNEDIAAIKTELAVLEKGQVDLVTNVDKLDTNNREDHKAIIDKIDSLDERLMKRLDAVAKYIKNGGG